MHMQILTLCIDDLQMQCASQNWVDILNILTEVKYPLSPVFVIDTRYIMYVQER
jgi:hypothetical protein